MLIARRIIDETTRERLAKLVDLRMKINDLIAQLETTVKENSAISQDQKRFRENIEALAKTSEAKTLIARYIAKANEQETRLEEMEKERKTINAEKERLERELAVAITVFEIK
jgi:chromosome segregation ATPase